jgi:hypothetical protein
MNKILVLLFLSVPLFANEEISYDDGIPRYGHTNGPYTCPPFNAYWAVKFTPSRECRVKAGKVHSYIMEGVSQTCSLFVWDRLGSSETRSAITTYSPSEFDWDTIELPVQPVYDTDFYLGVWVTQRTMGVQTICVLTDSGIDYPGRYYGRLDAGPWRTPTIMGDVMIRAIVEYEEGVEEELLPLSKRVVLNQNSPNPVLNETTISYVLPEKTGVKLKVYDATGRVVKTLVDAVQTPGLKQVVWDRRNTNGKAMSSGIYFYKLSVDNAKSFTNTMVVL